MKKSVSLLFLATILLGASEGGCGDDEPSPIVLPLVECSPENCGGCCEGTQCNTGNASDSCGNGGATCATCAGLSACSPDGQSCALNLQAYVTVQPTSASIVSLDPRDNDSWDLDGSEPDVVVELRCPVVGGDQPLVTRTPEVSSYTPQWTTGGCMTQVGALLGRELQIKLIDVDLALDDEIVTVAYSLKEEDLRAGAISLAVAGYINSVTLTFVPAP